MKLMNEVTDSNDVNHITHKEVLSSNTTGQ